MPSVGAAHVVPGGPAVRVALADERGSFVGTCYADYAVADMPESVLRRIGGEAGLALVRATGRVTTSLFLSCGGTRSSTIVSGEERHTKYLDPMMCVPHARRRPQRLPLHTVAVAALTIASNPHNNRYKTS